MSNLKVAETIRQQLYTLGRVKVWSWGAKDFVGSSKESFLQFRVNALKFKGTVRITLNGSDTYDISFYKRGKLEKHHEVKDVFVDEMVDVIDNFVEYTGDNASYKAALLKEDEEKRNKTNRN